MKENLKIKLAEETQLAMLGENLRRPEKDRRDQRAGKNNGDKVNRQSECIFQRWYVRFAPDAESTYMEESETLKALPAYAGLPSSPRYGVTRRRGRHAYNGGGAGSVTPSA